MPGFFYDSKNKNSSYALLSKEFNLYEMPMRMASHTGE
jgi:hypothetical protein